MLTCTQGLSKLRGRLLQREPLADYTSWRVGGPADMVFIPADIQDLAEFLQHLPLDVPVFWLGLGSNVLIRDGGIEGAVIVTQGALNRITQLQPNIVQAQAGVSCAQIARFTARLGLAGLEFMAGIPGTIGGALAMNAGCYGSETWQYVHTVETINRAGQIQLRTPSDYEIGYRHVKGHQAEWFVAGRFILEPGDKNSSLNDIHNLLEQRNATQPTGFPNCGSVFRNPAGNYAAQLIEQSGLKKFTIGGATISDKHANFIINDGTASAADIEALIAHTQETVEQQHGVLLNPEVCIIGKTATR
ncbi:MAG: UDP-N-acetylmuramate dehydrogenase [Gammaproteobacteria bacterium]